MMGITREYPREPSLPLADRIAIRMAEPLDRLRHREQVTGEGVGDGGDIDANRVALAEAERDAEGRLKYPKRVLAHRAYELLDSTDDAKDRPDWKRRLERFSLLEEPSGILGVAASVAILGAIIWWAGWAMVLSPSDSGCVPLSGFFLVLFILLLSLCFTVAAQATLFISGTLRHKDASPGVRSDRLQALLRSVSQRASSLVLWSYLQNALMRLIRRGWGREHLQHLSRVLSRLFAALAPVLSHAFWIGATVAILMTLAFVMSFGTYDFEWRSTIEVWPRERVLGWFVPDSQVPSILYYLSKDPGDSAESLPPEIVNNALQPGEKEALHAAEDLKEAAAEYPRRGWDAFREPSIQASDTADGAVGAPEDESFRSRGEVALKAVEGWRQRVHGHLVDLEKALRDIRLPMAAGDHCTELHEALDRLGSEISDTQRRLPHLSPDDLEVPDVGEARLPGALQHGWPTIRGLEKQIDDSSKNAEAAIRKHVHALAKNRWKKECRDTLGWAILGGFFWIGLCPRVMLAVLGLVQYWWTLEKLDPDLRDEYFARLMEEFQDQDTRAHSLDALTLAPEVSCTNKSDGQPEPPERSNQPDAEGEHEGESGTVPEPENGLPATSTPGPPGTADGSAPLSPPAVEEDNATGQPSDPAEVFLCSYDIDPPDEGWSEVLGIAGPHGLRDLGGINTYSDRQEAIERVAQAGRSTAGLIVILDGSQSPDGPLQDYLERLAAKAFDETEERYLMLVRTRGELARQKYSVADLAELDRNWEGLRQKLCLARDSVLNFDHEHPAQQARSTIRDKCRDWWPSLFLTCGKDGDNTTLLEHALRIAVTKCQEAEGIHSDDERSAIASKAIEQIDSLYAGTAENWRQRIRNEMDTLQRKCRDAVEKLPTPEEDAAQLPQSMFRQLGDAGQSAMWTIMQAFHGLPRWHTAALVGTTGALAIGVAAVSVPAAALPFVAGIAGTLGLQRIALAAKRGFIRLVDPSPSEAASTEEAVTIPLSSLDDIVRSCIVRALVLEMQPLPPAKIAKRLSSILSRCSTVPVACSEAARKLCDEVTAAYHSDPVRPVTDQPSSAPR